MKSNKYFFAVVLSICLGACARGVTEPEMRAPDGPSAFVAPGDTTPTPPAPSPGQEPTDGMIGSGVGK